MIQFYHHDDPQGRDLHRWPYVYLHGAAEQHNASIGESHGWDAASDLFMASEPMPEHSGEYTASLYGMTVIAVINTRYGHKAGRVASLQDTGGLVHALRPEDWR